MQNLIKVSKCEELRQAAIEVLDDGMIQTDANVFCQQPFRRQIEVLKQGKDVNKRRQFHCCEVQ